MSQLFLGQTKTVQFSIKCFIFSSKSIWIRFRFTDSFDFLQLVPFCMKTYITHNMHLLFLFVFFSEIMEIEYPVVVSTQ